MQNISNDEAINALYGKLWLDPKLRIKALNNGNAAVEEILGQPIRDVKVVFHENSDSVVNLPLPPCPPDLNARTLNTLAQGESVSGERGLFDIIKKIIPIATDIISTVVNK